MVPKINRSNAKLLSLRAQPGVFDFKKEGLLVTTWMYISDICAGNVDISIIIDQQWWVQKQQE